MNIEQPDALLGGLSPAAFMRRHWQRKPLLVRQAIAGGAELAPRGVWFELASQAEVESRLVVRSPGGSWSLRRGPIPRRALPPLSQPGWTLLVQGVDLHLDSAHRLLQRFRFVPDARLDDLMVSYASDGGGVGPHVDSYDVFLLQLSGVRRWRIGRVIAPTFVPGLPLKILDRFEPDREWLLEPGDLLYLPPGWAHDGQAVGACTTASIGFRAPTESELARELLQRWVDAEASDAPARDRRYRDARAAATETPARIPDALAAFAADAVLRQLSDRRAIPLLLGETLSEPKPHVVFERSAARGGHETDQCVTPFRDLRLDARSKMLYDERRLYLNGEAFAASGRDARLLRRLADRRELEARRVSELSGAARELLDEWLAAGWLHWGSAHRIDRS